ncbi:MAG: TerB family tellurite resistance protein [Nannocystaceae bacterium]
MEASEEIYFKNQEMAARRKLREELDAAARKTQEDARRKDLVVRIQELGFAGERAKVFDLMPLIHVAWADGSISRQERAQILELLERRGITPGTDAFMMVETMLEEAPSQAFMDETMIVLREVAGGKRAESMVDLCIQIADASGGIFGLGERISDAERDRIEAIARAFGDQALARLHRTLAER